MHAHVPSVILPHMTPFHHLWTKSLILSQDWSISLSHLTPYDPLRPHINQCTCCWSVLSLVPCGIPPHMTPFHHLWTLSLILSYDWSISLAYLTPYDPLRPHINQCTCCWSMLVHVSCGIPPHITPFHHIWTLSLLLSHEWSISLAYLTP